MKKAILIVCVLALIAMASAAMADATGSKVFLTFKAGWYNGSTTAANQTTALGSSATVGTAPSSINAAYYNIASYVGTNAYATNKVAGNTAGYSFDLVVAPGTGAAVTDHPGDAHESMCYISAWNLDLWSGISGESLPTNWVVTATGAGIQTQGHTVTWSYSDLFRTSAPATTAVAPAGFWFAYNSNGGAHFTDYGSAIGLGNVFNVTIGLAPEPPATPEPGSLLALGSGLMGLVGFAIRRRRA